MAGKRSGRDKRRKRSHGEESHGERKRLNSDSSAVEIISKTGGIVDSEEGYLSLLQDPNQLERWNKERQIKFNSNQCEAGRIASEKEAATEHSDFEEGGLDLSISLKPISSYISDRKEMLEQCFKIIGEKKLQKMLPDILKQSCSVEEIKSLCLEQLTLLSDKKLLQIIEGEDLGSSETEEQAVESDRCKKKLETESQSYCLSVARTQGQIAIIRQDNNVDSTSSYKEHKDQEAPELRKGGASGDESDALSINAEAYDSDIEQNCNEQEESTDVLLQRCAPTPVGVADEIQKDIEKSVNEILGLSGSATGKDQSAAALNADSDGLQPSAQQLELLELEMRARAIKALMRAGDIKTQT
ncbi:caspase activity and apoptosis inhibitor 1 isoform X1 [Amblyraja radiata]|uniref:caspase activity and apoptosis inhibitor 1 isoform X1 n=1 Tax=Amblyraja radiata TaxID=386614 RepID=UPI0014039F27|nr:caspase activity and apoptosis inhibitor 1 isoform X1 [Amblyraja radiata]